MDLTSPASLAVTLQALKGLPAIINRQFVSLNQKDTQQSKESQRHHEENFRVMQWNILADGKKIHHLQH